MEGSKREMLEKILPLAMLCILIALVFDVNAFAAAYSDNWYEDSNGWHIKDGSGATIKNAWVCDDVQDPTRNTWYLIDGNGNTVSNPLVKDGTGNHYSLETAHDGYYGMLRYKNGTYDGVALTFEQSHNGSFGAVIGGLDALKSKYSVKDISNINNSNCIYTSSFGTGTGSSASTSSSSNGMSRTYYLENLVCVTANMSVEEQIAFVQRAVDIGLTTWEESCMGADQTTYEALKAFVSSFDWPNMSERERLEKVYNRIAIDNNGNTYKGGYSQKLDSWAVFNTGTGTCSNYASELIRLCRLVGLEAKSYDPEYNHVAVKVKIDDQWYAVDPTWYSSLNEYMEPCAESAVPNIPKITIQGENNAFRDMERLQICVSGKILLDFYIQEYFL